jgi:tetrahydromethanopterin S-methyltransferase subunit F
MEKNVSQTTTQPRNLAITSGAIGCLIGFLFAFVMIGIMGLLGV